MTRTVGIAVAVAITLAAGCSGQNPLSPTSAMGDGSLTLGPREPGGVTLAAAGNRPGAGQPFDVSFSNAGIFYSFAGPNLNAPRGTLASAVTRMTGSISGVAPQRVLKASGPAVLNVNGLVPGFDEGTYVKCGTAQDPALPNLVDQPLMGTLDIEVNEADRIMWVRHDGIQVPQQSVAWHVSGNSTVSFRAEIDWQPGGLPTVIQRGAELTIASNGKGKSYVAYGCRGYWHLVVSAVS
jgi:hypothetical protein